MHKMERSFSPEQPEPKEAIINETDKELIAIGLRKLIEVIENFGDEQLPDLILYLDTSARPLYYAVDPVINALYQNRHKTKPHSAFFQSFTGTSLSRDRYNAEKYADVEGDYQEHALNEMRDLMKNLNYKPEKIEENMQTFTDAKNELNKKRELMNIRAQEILEKAKLQHGANILVIDDYSTGERTSLYETYQAFAKQDIDIKITAFAFLSGIPISAPDVYKGDDWERTLTDEEWAQTDQFPDSPNFQVYIGAIDPKTERYARSPRFESQGFGYRTSNRYGLSTDVFKQIGVTKDATDPLSLIYPVRDPEKMGQLREELKQLGEEVSTEFVR